MTTSGTGVSVTASLTSHPLATSSSLGISLGVDFAIVRDTTTSTPTLRAYLGDKAVVTANGTGDVSFVAAATATAIADAAGFGISLGVAAGVTRPRPTCGRPPRRSPSAAARSRGRNVTLNSRVNVDASGNPIAPTYTYNTVDRQRPDAHGRAGVRARDARLDRARRRRRGRPRHGHELARPRDDGRLGHADHGRRRASPSAASRSRTARPTARRSPPGSARASASSSPTSRRRARWTRTSTAPSSGCLRDGTIRATSAPALARTAGRSAAPSASRVERRLDHRHGQPVA